VVIICVLGQDGLVALIVIVAMFVGAIKSGIIALKVVFVPMLVNGPPPVTFHSKVVFGSVPPNRVIVNETVSPGQYELTKLSGLIVTLGVAKTVTVTVSDKYPQAAGSIVLLAVSGKS